MCSTTRGPAIWPSLVTWPTRISGAPERLAKRISACAEPRTCVTVPGADSIALGHMVWIESMTTRRGILPSRQRGDDVLDRGLGGELDRRRRRGRAARRAAAPAPPPPRRRCRPRGGRRCASAAATWISMVDLPMPGSPAISSTEPRTKPPPVTRSNSATPDGRRGASWVSPASGSSLNSRPLRGARPPPGAGAATPSSTSVFHSPQASHLPCQRPRDRAAVLADEADGLCMACGHVKPLR